MKKLFSIILLLTIALRALAVGSNNDRYTKYWTYNGHDFPNSMTMIGVINVDGEELQSESIEIGAFSGGECRGSEILSYYPNADRYLVFLTVYGTANDVIIFKLYDHANNLEYSYGIESILFTANAIYGSVGNPYVFDFSSNITYYTVTTNVLPSGTGSVTGGGSYQNGQLCTLTASPNYGYKFLYWMQDGNEISTNSTYTFTVTEDATYSACFITNTTYNLHWNFNPHQYEHTMTIVGLVQIDGEEQRVPYYEVGAFCNNECRGSAMLQYLPRYDKYLAFLTVYGEDGNSIKFKLYNHNNNHEVSKVTPAFSFVTDTICGNPNDPFVFVFTDYLTITPQAYPSYMGSVAGGGNFLPGETCTVTATPYNGYAFKYWTYNGDVVSTNTEYSFYVDQSKVLRAVFCQELPDLHVTSITHSEFIAGQPATISWTVKNDGYKSTSVGQTWNDYIWLASTVDLRLYDPNDIHLATVDNLMALDPGESYTNSVTVTLPIDITGSQYIFVLTDMVDAFNIAFPQSLPPDPYTPSIIGNPYNYFTASVHGGGVIPELQDYDNFFYKSVQIMPGPTPDLVVTNIAHPTNIVSGTSMPLSFTVTNQGEVAAVGSWYDAVYLSSSPEFNMATAYHLGTYLRNTGLGVGQSYTYATNVDIPIEFYDAYYVIVETDVTHVIYESIFDDNNVGCSDSPVNITMAARPNLVVESITVPSAMSVNKSYDISFTVKNIGAGVATESSWNDAVYLSNDDVLDYGDITLKVIRHYNTELLQDDTYTYNTSIYIPNYISGEWYILVKTDKDNNVFEFLDEDDNVSHSENPVTILIPELSITELWLDEVVDPNIPTEVEWTVKNNGSGLASGTMKDYIGFNDQKVDSVYTYVYLDSNDSIVITKMITIPCVDQTSGTISVTTNANFNIIESDSTNNVISNTVSVVIPDLLIEQTSISDEGWSSEPIEVKYTVTNNGTGAFNKVTTDNIYISSNQNDFSNATLIYSYQRLLNLTVGDKEDVDLSINLPDGISGIYYIGVFANDDGAICEGDNTNINSIVSEISVSLSPYPNLQVVSASIESTPINVGSYALIWYTIKNVGDGALNNRSWTDKFYVSPTPTYNENTAELIGEHRTTASIAVNDSVAVSAGIIIPNYISAGYHYMIVIADVDNEIYEYDGENDNQCMGVLYQFNIYPCDLQALNVQGPTEVSWASTVTYTLQGKNNSDIATLYSRWNDKLYLSNDNQLSADDIELASRTHYGQLDPAGEYQTIFNVTIPYGMVGDCYIIGVVDAQSWNPDIQPQNNLVATLVTVNSIPTPDLEVTDIVVLDDFVSGQMSRVAYTVTNVGEADIQNKQWSDRFYLSNDDVYLQLKNNAKQLSLTANESYTDTVQVVVPIQYGGNYDIIAMTNASQAFYETSFDNNSLGTMVQVSVPLPGDLIVQNIASEYEVVSGGMLHVSWDIKNIGAYTLSGNGLKSLVYMSSDMEFDVNDRLLGGVVSNTIMLPANATLSQELTARISGVSEGDYYLIVLTNATKTFNESDFDNNDMVSENTFSVTMRILPYSTPLTDTLENSLANDYRLNVGEYTHETVRIHLHSADSLQGAINNIFVTHNGVGSNLNYDYSTIEQFTANPELYIPSTQLEYYGVNVIGNTPVGNEQSIVIQADILPFDLRSISPSYGGNTGKVTVELTGSKFSVDMKVSLFNSEETIEADTVYFQSFYKAYATFDLTDKPAGLYTIGISDLCEGDVYLENAFEIRQGEPEKLSTNILYPNSPRPNRNIILMLEFGNTGNVDITAPVIRLTSIGGSWVALTAEGVVNHDTDILIPLQIEDGPQGVLRPGSYGIVNVFCYTNNALVFTIKRIQ